MGVVVHEQMAGVLVRLQITDAPQDLLMAPVTLDMVARQAWSILTPEGDPVWPAKRGAQEFGPIYRPDIIRQPGEVSEGWITFDAGFVPDAVMYRTGPVAVRWDAHPAAERKLIEG
jgi:hypothetical protein